MIIIVVDRNKILPIKEIRQINDLSFFLLIFPTKSSAHKLYCIFPVLVDSVCVLFSLNNVIQTLGLVLGVFF